MAGTRFDIRVVPHDEFVKEVKRDLLSWGYEVIDNGRESRMPGWNGELLESNLFRRAPDLIVKCGRKIIFIDPKTSTYIEREPYETYVGMAELKETVLVVVKHESKIVFGRAQDIELVQPWHKIWPIIDGWITPRAHPDYDYLKRNYDGRGNGYHGSGTPFNKIDTSRMIDWGPMFFAWTINGGF